MRRLIAITVIVMMVLLLLPAWAFAENDGSSQQIGKYFDVSEKDGTISSPVPGLTGETVRSYENDKVKVNKTIFGTDTENVFDITLDVSVDETVTFDVQETSGDAAAVLVVDLSSSMTNTYRNSTKISAANYAIDAFVARFKEDMNGSTRYIAVVGFGGYSGNKDKKDGARTHWDWTQVTSDTAISDLSVKTSTGTNLEAGLILAKNLLGQKLYNGKNEEITNKSIILLSDGQPTYYVNGNEKYSTSTDVICANGSNMGGNGSNTEHACHTPVETLMYSDGFKGIHKYAVYIGGRNDKLDCTSNNCPDRKTGIQEWLGNECGFTTILADGAGNIDLGTVFENIATHITLEGTPGLVT
ncbi:MAG: VWA domain-containing protein, partial [Clostridia bacterium]|nr:VWA domain-containing protein [Clostridia bacterium]